MNESQLTILLDSVEGALIEEQQKVEFMQSRKRIEEIGELEDPTLNFTFNFADKDGDGLMCNTKMLVS